MTPTRSQIEGWKTDHLTASAERFIARAKSWIDEFDGYHKTIDKPGGTAWTGMFANGAFDLASTQKTLANNAAATLEDLAKIATDGAASITDIRQRILDLIADAEAAGFKVNEDLSVEDTRSSDDEDG